MTQDCSMSLSIAKEKKSLPNGIHITRAENDPAPGMDFVSKKQAAERILKTSEKVHSWGYIYIRNMAVQAFEEKMEDYNACHEDARHACFVHRSYRYKARKDDKGAKKELRPTISGLVFLQGRTKDLQLFLKEHFPQYHLVNNCSTGKPAAIEDRVMKSFMALMSAAPENITFLREPFERFAKEHVRLRVLSGLFKGQEGYIVRIDRDRQLVMDFAGYAVAIRGLHKEDFEEVR